MAGNEPNEGTMDPTATGGILCVFAHPDDEQFGTSGALAAAAERSIPVRVLCFTRGDRGEISDPSLATRETLPDVREAELREACAILGLLLPIVLDYGDGRLAERDREELRDVVVTHLRAERPRVVLTFDRNGGYGHADHIAIHHATVAAVDAAADGEHRPDLGRPHRIDKLYFTAYPRGALAELNEAFRRHGIPQLDFGDVQTIADHEFGTADARVTTVVHVDPYWERRYASFRAHRTQYGPDSPFLRLPEPVFRELMRFDRFVRHRPAPAPVSGLPDEHDLWHGLE
jgi:N-acetyl-1-D-myo-inositol-2-amino-2-deoxy-alpha-D-glucopyranoside deacetylase